MNQIVGTLLEGPCLRMPWYTDLRVVFDAFGGREREFDWLLTDLDCNRFPSELQGDEVGFTFGGDELSDLVRRQDPPVQFVWAVLTGVERGTRIDLHDLPVVPVADGNRDLWRGGASIQYPGASVELVCWDSGATLLMTSDPDLTARFRAALPEAVDLRPRP